MRACYVKCMEINTLTMSQYDKFMAVQKLKNYLHIASVTCAFIERDVVKLQAKIIGCKSKKKKRLEKAVKKFNKRIDFWQSKRILYKAQLRDLEAL